MISKSEVREAALGAGFHDIGFAPADVFSSQMDYLDGRDDSYSWTKGLGLRLTESVDPRKVLGTARSVIVLIYSYFEAGAPLSLERHYGRCYHNDDRVTRDGMALKIKAFRNYLREKGIDSKLSPSMPDKLAAATAGTGTFGKNCLFYASGAAGGSSFVMPVVVVTDAPFEPDTPTVETGCPEWCRNACVAACPTGALTGRGMINPLKCISYLTYHGEGLTPSELREPMGQYIYGCDRCQNVCPRNSAWLAKQRDVSSSMEEMAEVFAPEAILMMDREYFEKYIFPRMFYMPYEDAWRWRMNAARAMGNSLDRGNVPALVRGFEKNDDWRVQSMIAWSLGRLGGDDARRALCEFRKTGSGRVLSEIEAALENN